MLQATFSSWCLLLLSLRAMPHRQKILFTYTIILTGYIFNLGFAIAQFAGNAVALLSARGGAARIFQVCRICSLTRHLECVLLALLSARGGAARIFQAQILKSRYFVRLYRADVIGID